MLDADIKTKIKDYQTELPQTDTSCFPTIQGENFKNYSKVTLEFYQPIIDARKTQTGS